MARRNRAECRDILPDPKYKDVRVAKFINMLMLNGNKSLARTIVYDAMDMLSNSGQDALSGFIKALEQIMPEVEVRSKRIGGATYQVPREVSYRRKLTLSIRWIIDAARNRNEKTMTIRLHKELLDALEGKGAAFKKKEDVRKMAEANRAFAHYS